MLFKLKRFLKRVHGFLFLFKKKVLGFKKNPMIVICKDNFKKTLLDQKIFFMKEITAW